ncbi:hypothetical protein [Neobacillus muris]|nr:hypothetical protein [Neobacillus muris]
MSKSLWLTPEEVMIRKKRKKVIIYAISVTGTVVLSALVTILANGI